MSELSTTKQKKRKRWRKSLLARGLCRFCAKPAVTRVYCEDHRKESAERAKRWHETKKAQTGIDVRVMLRAKAKTDVIALYGGGCKHCGETIPSFLNLDHVNDDGNKEPRVGLFWKVWKSGFDPSYQLLCFGCNYLKALARLRTVKLTQSAVNIRRRRNYQLLREGIIKYYGAACSCCKQTNPDLLTVDHINNDGYAERKKPGMAGGEQFYRNLRDQGYPDGYRLLCWNCNSGRAVNGGVCPHARANLTVEGDKKLIRGGQQCQGNSILKPP